MKLSAAVRATYQGKSPGGLRRGLTQTTRATHPASSFAWMVTASKDLSTLAGAHLRCSSHVH